MKKFVCAFLLSTCIIGFSSIVSNAYSVTKNVQYFPNVYVWVSSSEAFAYIHRGSNCSKDSSKTQKVGTDIRNTSFFQTSHSGII